MLILLFGQMYHITPGRNVLALVIKGVTVVMLQSCCTISRRPIGASAFRVTRRQRLCRRYGPRGVRASTFVRACLMTVSGKESTAGGDRTERRVIERIVYIVMSSDGDCSTYKASTGPVRAARCLVSLYFKPLVNNIAHFEGRTVPLTLLHL